MASTPTRDLQEEFLAATRKSQETVVRAIKTWVETVRTVTPKLPSVYAPLSDRLPTLPLVTMPFADKLPTPDDVVANGYDFAEHLLALQRKFAEDLLSVTEPLFPANAGAVTAPAANSEPKPAPVAAAAEPAPAAPKAEFKSAASHSAPVAQPVPKAVAVPSAPKVPAVKAEPKVPAVKPAAARKAPAVKPAAARKAPAVKPAAARKAPAAKSAPKPTAAKNAGKSAAKPASPRRAPKNTDAS